MRKKYNDDFDDEENEFDVDEPEEIQNNGSDDDWTPEMERESAQGRRQSSRLRSLPKLRQPIIDASSSDEGSADEESDGGRKRKSKSKPSGGGRRGRPPAKKSKTSFSSAASATPASTNSEKTSSDLENSNSNSSTNATSDSATNNGTTHSGSPNVRVSKDFTSGAFVVLKTDFINSTTDPPPIWKIDGKALLQKYVPFFQDGKTLYKNTSVYSGWTINNKDSYYPITVIFKQQSRKEHVVEFQRDLVKVDETVTSD